MKRNITAIFLVIAIMFGNMFLFPVSAADPVSIVIGTQSVASTATEVSIPVSIAGNNGITAFELNLSYDINMLTFDPTSTANKNAFKNANVVAFDISDVGLITEGKIKAIGMAKTAADSVTANGELFTLTFGIKASSTGTAKIELESGTVERNANAANTGSITTSTTGKVIILGATEIGSVQVGSKEAKLNGNVSVPVTMSLVNNEKIAGYWLEIAYDSTVLELDETETLKNFNKFGTNAISDIDVASSTSISSNKVVTVAGLYYTLDENLENGSVEDVSANGKLFDLVFTVKSGEGTTTDITIEEAYAVKADVTAGKLGLNFSNGNGSVTISGAATGGLIALKDESKSNEGYVIKDMDELGMILIVPGEATKAETLLLLKEVAGHSFNIDTNGLTGTLIGTGMVIELKDGSNVVDSVIVLKYGDVLGNGAVGIDEALYAFDHYAAGETLLDDVYLEAGKVCGANSVGIDEALEIFDYYAAGGTGLFSSVDY